MARTKTVYEYQGKTYYFSSEKLNALITEKYSSQKKAIKDISKVLEKDEKTVRGWLSGTHGPSEEAMKDLCGMLSIEIDALGVERKEIDESILERIEIKFDENFSFSAGMTCMFAVKTYIDYQLKDYSMLNYGIDSSDFFQPLLDNLIFIIRFSMNEEIVIVEIEEEGEMVPEQRAKYNNNIYEFCEINDIISEYLSDIALELLEEDESEITHINAARIAKELYKRIRS